MIIEYPFTLSDDRTVLVRCGKVQGNVVIPDCVKRIGQAALCGGRGMTSIEIPDSVTIIDKGAFWACGELTSIHVSAGNPKYASIDGVLFNRDITSIIKCPEEYEAKEYEIPDTVTRIGYDAFRDCCELTSIKIPGSVTSIDEKAFYFCSGLPSIEIPSSVRSVGNYAFDGCKMLTEFHSGIKDVTVFGYYNILDHELNDTCTIYVPEGCVDAYRNHPAFREFKNIVEEEGCGDEPVNSIMEGYPYTLSDDRTVFVRCDREYAGNLVIPDSVRSIGDGAFLCCGRITSIEIPDSVRSIGCEAFAGCSGLTHIDIPDSVTSIGGCAFAGCI